jgi:putative acetyltransferase
MLPLTRPDKQGRPILLRRLTVDDIATVHALERRLVDDGRGMVMDPDELPPTPEAMLARKQSLYAPGDPDQALALGAFDGATLLGNFEVQRLRLRRLRHVASFGMGVDPAQQGRGIGRLLAETGVAWSDAVGVLRLELYVRADNPRAIALYDSLGFELQCTRPRFVRHGDGWLDDHYMARSGPALHQQ